jgi:hypothetical protein
VTSTGSLHSWQRNISNWLSSGKRFTWSQMWTLDLGNPFDHVGDCFLGHGLLLLEPIGRLSTSAFEHHGDDSPTVQSHEDFFPNGRHFLEKGTMWSRSCRLGSNPSRQIRICKLLRVRCLECQRCQGCHRALPWIAPNRWKFILSRVVRKLNSSPFWSSLQLSGARTRSHVGRGEFKEYARVAVHSE